VGRSLPPPPSSSPSRGEEISERGSSRTRCPFPLLGGRDITDAQRDRPRFHLPPHEGTGRLLWISPFPVWISSPLEGEDEGGGAEA
jgi:hypothetical protein